jgi:lipoprotein NlpI
MRVVFLAVLFSVLSCLGAARGDDFTLHLAFQHCGQDRNLQACDELVNRSDLDGEQRATAYAARGWVRYVLTDLTGARADLVKAQALDPHNDEVEILRDRLSDVTDDPYKKLLFHCTDHNEKDARIRIQACTQLINLTTPKLEALSKDYELRSAAYFDAGNFADARTDLLKAQQLDPTMPGYRMELIVATYATGDYQAALSETEEAIAKAPYPSGKLMLLHGQLAYLTGQDSEAITNYQSSLKLYAGDLDSSYWLDMLRLEQHQDVAVDMLHLLTALNANALGADSVRFQLGEMTPQAYMDRANRGPTDNRPERLCAAYFNLGHKAWRAGDLADARHDFQEALQTNRYALIEYQASKVLLHKLGG